MIHFAWVNPPLSPLAEFVLERWAELNPTEDIQVHGLEALHGVYADVNARFKLAKVQQADLVRLSVLEQYGGWYFDLDLVPFAPIEQFKVLETSQYALGAPVSMSRYCNNALYSPPDERWSKWAREILERMMRVNSYSGKEKLSARAELGPHLIRGLHTQYGAIRPIPWYTVNPYGTHVSAVKAFEQYLRRDLHRPDSLPPDTLALHLWGQTSVKLRELGF